MQISPYSARSGGAHQAMPTKDETLQRLINLHGEHPDVPGAPANAEFSPVMDNRPTFAVVRHGQDALLNKPFENNQGETVYLRGFDDSENQGISSNRTRITNPLYLNREDAAPDYLRGLDEPESQDVSFNRPRITNPLYLNREDAPAEPVKKIDFSEERSNVRDGSNQSNVFSELVETLRDLFGFLSK